MPPERKINPVIATVVVIVLVVGLTVGILVLQRMNSTDQTTQTDTTDTSTPTNADTTNSDTTTTETTPDTTSAAYADGTYSAVGSYMTPGGNETITVTVTLAGDVVTDTSATGSATTGDSSEYQAQFLNGYKADVVGKGIDTISLSRVSGSSLTSTGFNKALEAIKADAAA